MRLTGLQIRYISGVGSEPKKINEPKLQEVKRGERGEKERGERGKRGGETNFFMAPKIYKFLALKSHKSGTRKGDSFFGSQGSQVFFGFQNA